MPGRRPSRGHDRWVAQLAAFDGSAPARRNRKEPITVDRIIDATLELIEAESFDAVTMRRVASALDTGAGSLYAHVQNKAELDGLLIGRLCQAVTIPEPDPADFVSPSMAVCRQLRDQYLRYPGVSRAALSAAPTSLDALRIGEGMLTLLLTGGVTPQIAAWTVDAALLYVAGYCLEASLRREPETDTDGRVLSRAEIIERLEMLPVSHFPNTVAHARELTRGDGHDRFEFTLDALFSALTSSAQHDGNGS